MKYLKYFERKDVEQSQSLLKLSKDIIFQFYELWKNSINWKGDGDIMSLFGPPLFSVTYKLNGEYILIWIVDDKDKKGSFSKANEKDYKFIIKIAYADLCDKLNKLETLIETDSDKANALIVYLTTNKEIYKYFIHVLSHELSHYEDELKYDIFSEKGAKDLAEIKKTLGAIGIPDEDKEELNKIKNQLYYNLNTEYNAFFLMFCSEELEAMQQHYEESNEKWLEMTYQEYYKYFENMITSNADFDPKTTKKLQTRLYQFYQDIKKLDEEIFKSKN